MKFRELGKFREKDENPELQSRYRKKKYKCNAPSINNGPRASLTTVSSSKLSMLHYALGLILEPVPFPWHGCPYIISNEHFWGGDSDTTFASLRTDYRNFDPILLAKIVLRKTTLTMIGFHSLDVCKTLIRGCDMSEETRYSLCHGDDRNFSRCGSKAMPNIQSEVYITLAKAWDSRHKYWGMRWKNDDAIHWDSHVFPCHWHSRHLYKK